MPFRTIPFPKKLYVGENIKDETLGAKSPDPPFEGLPTYEGKFEDGDVVAVYELVSINKLNEEKRQVLKPLTSNEYKV